MNSTSARDRLREAESDVRSALELQNDEDEIAHVVCCRDPIWKVAFCGYESDAINLTATVVCSMCIEVARSRDPAFGTRDIPTCPLDLKPCPDEHEIDLRILREVSS